MSIAATALASAAIEARAAKRATRQGTAIRGGRLPAAQATIAKTSLIERFSPPSR